MKKIMCLILVGLMFCSVGCASGASIMEDVKIENVENEGYRPQGYDGPGGVEGGFDWAGFYVTGNVTNETNKTFNDVKVIIRYYKTSNMATASKKEYFIEDTIYKLNPNDTQQFSVDINYEELGVDMTWMYDWEVYDVKVAK